MRIILFLLFLSTIAQSAELTSANRNIFITIRTLIKKSNPLLIELSPNEQFSLVQAKVAIEMGISVDKQIYSYQGKEIKILGTDPISKLYSLTGIRKRRFEFMFFVSDTPTPISNQPQSILSSSILINSTTPNVNQTYGRCAQGGHEDPWVKVILGKQCIGCRHFQSARYSEVEMYGEYPEINCSECKKKTKHEIIAKCGEVNCEKNLSFDCVYPNVIKDARGNLLVKFSGCNCLMSKDEFQEHILSAFISVVVKKIDKNKFVFKCRCSKPNAFAALNTKNLLPQALKSVIESYIVNAADIGWYDHHCNLGFKNIAPPVDLDAADAIFRELLLENCLSQIKELTIVRCPTCQRNCERDSIYTLETTRATCSNSRCPQFCIFCLKVEPNVEGQNLLVHTFNSGLDPKKCPLFLEQHPLFSDDSKVALKDFFHWRTVRGLYEHLDGSNLLGIVVATIMPTIKVEGDANVIVEQADTEQVATIKRYVEDFDFYKLLLDKIAEYCSFPACTPDKSQK